MASRPLRCLAMAIAEDVGVLADYDGATHRGHAMLIEPSGFAALEQNMVFVCVVMPQN